MNDIESMTQQVIQFRDDRNWKQFHTLKNLIVSLNLEASELLELTQWKTDDALMQGKTDSIFAQALGDECADVFMYLLLVAEAGGIDLMAATKKKIEKNAQRYPISQAYGSSKKYTVLNNADQDKSSAD